MRYSPLTWTMGILAFPGEPFRDRDFLDDLLDFRDSVEVLVVLRRGEWVLNGVFRDDDDGPWSASGSALDSANNCRVVVLLCCGEIACGVGVSATWSTRAIS